jgi:hypothetical protein
MLAQGSETLVADLKILATMSAILMLAGCAGGSDVPNAFSQPALVAR